jgi:hypothetical protein
MEMQQMIKHLLAKQEEMLVRIQEKMAANTKAHQEQMLAKMEANTKAMSEDIKSGRAGMRSTVGAIEEKMDAWIANMRDDQKYILPINNGGTSRMRGGNPSRLEGLPGEDCLP